MIDKEKRTYDLKIYTVKERSDMAQTILYTYFPFLSMADVSQLFFTVAGHQNSIKKMLTVFKNEIFPYYIIAFHGKKKYKSKITFEEIELLMPMLIKYDLYHSRRAKASWKSAFFLFKKPF
jgi:hypothetical protein